ncbi:MULTISPECIES: sensor histidine kinase [Sporomusa]|jgi:two-component system sensor histidine kinase DegS|uniref:histidine kinase n=1 Tax=Sporomusa sphaeroides DSM 2875 TaxID=1337886 RepID=A0ABM9W239_9FIRM|nr:MULTISPECIES: sensor histidine kinase [Sporomusa]MCM0761350.1 sensor histidine kinase [Sporomusa sphaeroides DSM 2875]OLS56642.1 signal transduction histidine-protein kinase/phosphatase DegS [Sporomusa sphaeroides DSM 2875]CVK18990.1 Signal transduction histidine-protein kinase/phosphatase DegS [Sporomusa sphaeroides DSM 2875]HML32636.1 sensor histidine kinase [Sporomusa sphaeroides]
MINIDAKALDKIVKNTIAAVERSKAQIFDIYDAARVEMEKVRLDVERVKQETADIIFRVDELEKKERRSRYRLMEVSRNFRQYTEDDIKAAYEDTSNVQLELAMARLQEQNLRRQRDELELRLKTLKSTVEKAEELASQVGAVLGYWGSQMGDVVTQIESLQARQNFGAKIIKAQEEERRRVSREIHDGPAQAMANIVFRAEVCERLMESDVARAKHELGDLREQVRIALKETRKIIFDLRPMTLDDLGLVPTIRKVLETIKERSAVFSEVKVLGTEKRLEPHIEIGLFRIIQEALSNVEKHAKASNIWVRIDFRPSVVSAVVEDDGRGFDTVESVGNESFGLMGMRERINLLRGELTIKSEVGKGTRVFVTVPLGP